MCVCVCVYIYIYIYDNCRLFYVSNDVINSKYTCGS